MLASRIGKSERRGEKKKRTGDYAWLQSSLNYSRNVGIEIWGFYWSFKPSREIIVARAGHDVLLANLVSIVAPLDVVGRLYFRVGRKYDRCFTIILGGFRNSE